MSDLMSPELRAFIALLERNEGIPFETDDDGDDCEEDKTVTLVIDVGAGDPFEFEIDAGLYRAAQQVATRAGLTFDRYLGRLLREARLKQEALK